MDDRAEDRLRSEIAELRDQVDDLPETHEVDRLSRDLSTLTRDLETTTEELAELRARTDGLDETVEALDHQLRDTRHDHTRALDSLRQQVQWLERHVRSSAGAITTELATTPELRTLAERAERGKVLEAQQLDSVSRAIKQDAVRAWADWQTGQRKTCQAIVAASRSIAETTPQARDRRGAVSAYRAARSDLVELRDRRDRTRTAANAAQSELDDDAEQGSRAAADITRGQQAATWAWARRRMPSTGCRLASSCSPTARPTRSPIRWSRSGRPPTRRPPPPGVGSGTARSPPGCSVTSDRRGNDGRTT